MTSPAGLDWLATAVLLLDDHLIVASVNPAAESLLAQGRKQLVGSPVARLFTGNDRFLARLGGAVSSESGFTENELALELAGRTVPLSCAVSPVRENGFALLVELRELDQPLRIIREAKQLGLEQAHRELLRNLAHEIKNPLGGIRGAAQLLERELPAPELREFTQVIVKEADRLQALMNRLLTPHRLPRIEMVNIHEVMERVRMLLAAEHPDGLEIRREYDVSLPEFPADRESLIQAILNVARNAAQALDGQGEIRFRTRVVRQPTVARQRYRLAIGIDIEDNGPGVPADIADKIFLPLVSGREGGTGLGLSLSQSYVRQHNGLIEFESAQGLTRFTVLLPVRTAEQAGLATKAAS